MMILIKEEGRKGTKEREGGRKENRGTYRSKPSLEKYEKRSEAQRFIGAKELDRKKGSTC